MFGLFAFQRGSRRLSLMGFEGLGRGRRIWDSGAGAQGLYTSALKLIRIIHACSQVLFSNPV